MHCRRRRSTWIGLSKSTAFIHLVIIDYTNMSTAISDIERINHLEWRLKRLENFVGKSDQFEKKRINEAIKDLNEQILRQTGNNNNAKSLFNKADEINHLTSSEFQRRLLADRSTKLELILADEERIREITKSLSEIETLARVLDGDHFQGKSKSFPLHFKQPFNGEYIFSPKEIPKLFANLNKLLINHNNNKTQHGEFTQELSAFLQDYASFTLMMDENLQQYKQILNKNHKTSMELQDNPVE